MIAAWLVACWRRSSSTSHKEPMTTKKMTMTMTLLSKKERKIRTMVLFLSAPNTKRCGKTNTCARTKKRVSIIAQRNPLASLLARLQGKRSGPRKRRQLQRPLPRVAVRSMQGPRRSREHDHLAGPIRAFLCRPQPRLDTGMGETTTTMQATRSFLLHIILPCLLVLLLRVSFLIHSSSSIIIRSIFRSRSLGTSSTLPPSRTAGPCLIAATPGLHRRRRHQRTPCLFHPSNNL